MLLHDFAARVGTASDEHGYGDNQAVRLENGRKALDYMEADEGFSAASFKDSMEQQGTAVHQDELIHCRKNGGVRSENMGNCCSISMLVETAGEFALSDFYVTRIADRQSSIMGWGISLLGSKIDRREEAREAERGVWTRYNRE